MNIAVADPGFGKGGFMHMQPHTLLMHRVSRKVAKRGEKSRFWVFRGGGG